MSDAALVGLGFSFPASANSFYPALSPRDHVHLGVPTQDEDRRIAKPGHRYVDYVSIKADDKTYTRLDRQPDGRFKLRAGKQLLPEYEERLRALDLLAE